MINQDIKFQIIDKLSTLDICDPNNTHTQYVVRCPYCGDSVNLSHGHFSIHIDVDSETPMMYRCFKCDIKGILNDDVLSDLGLYVDSALHDSFRKFNRKISKKYKLINSEKENYFVPLYSESAFNREKLNYINNRLGINMSYVDARDMKVVLDLFLFMKVNEIASINGMTFNQIKFINDNYVGFLSVNNNCITFRKIKDMKYGLRYYKVILNPKNINGDTFFSIPNQIDLMYTNDINIHIAEGVFDILSIYKNVNNSNNQNNFYYASCGFGYLTIIKYLIYHGINTGIHLHIYSDNDKTDWNHKKYLFKESDVTEWIDHITIHRNGYQNEKDYGVLIDHIIDTKKKLK